MAAVTVNIQRTVNFRAVDRKSRHVETGHNQLVITLEIEIRRVIQTITARETRRLGETRTRKHGMLRADAGIDNGNTDAIPGVILPPQFGPQSRRIDHPHARI